MSNVQKVQMSTIYKEEINEILDLKWKKKNITCVSQGVKNTITCFIYIFFLTSTHLLLLKLERKSLPNIDTTILNQLVHMKSHPHVKPISTNYTYTVMLCECRSRTQNVNDEEFETFKSKHNIHKQIKYIEISFVWFLLTFNDV